MEGWIRATTHKQQIVAHSLHKVLEGGTGIVYTQDEYGGGGGGGLCDKEDEYG